MEKKMIFVVAAYAAFLATFNETFLNVAITPIMEDLGISIGKVQWLVTAYMLGAAIMVPISAFMYKKVSTKKLFLFTVSLLVIGSFIGAIAPNFKILLLGRIIQSLGSGLLVPIGMNITLSVVPKNKLGSYMGIMGAMTTLGPSCSVIVAGILLSAFSWHSLLIVFGIMSLALFILAKIYLTDVSQLTNPKIDCISVILISLSLIGILYGISTIFAGNKLISIIIMIIGGICLYLFVSRQNKITEPLINLKPLKIKPFRLGVIINILALMIVFAMNIIMPLFLQNVLKAPSFNASLTLFPAILCSCFIAPIAGKIFDKKGIKNLILIGFSIMLIFTVLLIIISNSNSLLLFALLYIPVICASALIIGPIQSYALSKLTPELNAHGVTIMSTGFQIAGCMGSSIFTGVYSLAILKNNAPTNGFVMSLCLIVLTICISITCSLLVRKIVVKKSIDGTIKLADLMKKNVFTIRDTDTIKDAMKKIVDNGISGLPVLNNNDKIVGFISDGDIIKYLSSAHPLFTNVYSFLIMNEEHDFDNKMQELMCLKVKDISKKKVITVDINSDLGEVCRLLTNNHLKKMPVMNNGKLVGIINTSNITKYAIAKQIK